MIINNSQSDTYSTVVNQGLLTFDSGRHYELFASLLALLMAGDPSLDRLLNKDMTMCSTLIFL